jgi:hypothetical protein
MSDHLKPGQPVEAKQIIMYGLDAVWCGSYTFAYYETDATRPPILFGTAPTCIVEIADGALQGAPVRYTVESVRAARP